MKFTKTTYQVIELIYFEKGYHISFFNVTSHEMQEDGQLGIQRQAREVENNTSSLITIATAAKGYDVISVIPQSEFDETPLVIGQL